MTSLPSCPVCLEEFERDINPPHNCSPCGHSICKNCLEQWQNNNNRGRLTCPVCRQGISNHFFNIELMNLIENSNQGESNHENNTNSNAPIQFNFHKKKNRKDLILDKSDSTIIVIDNSCSMGIPDGKIFTKSQTKLIKNQGVTRWAEAKDKILKVALYNIKRNINSAYYLLNPNKKLVWEENIDFVEIDTTNSTESFKILKNNLLDENNIRGNTPLDVITQYFASNLVESNKENPNLTISYNIFTDGEPNNKFNFEKEIKNLAKNHSIFLTINLCTEDDIIVEYYNNLDKKIGNELSGMDVIDDQESEEQEILGVNNNFITYCEEIHIARMAGCYSIISDLLDETELPPFYAVKLIKEITGNPTNLPHWTDRELFIKDINVYNKQVFSIEKQKNISLININKLNRMIWIYNTKQKFKKCKINYSYLLWGSALLIFILTVGLF
jgi:hypothetical protein